MGAGQRDCHPYAGCGGCFSTWPGLQIFSSASEHSSLIIEYVQRFGDFDGFFAKDNVAELTQVAGVEEELIELQAQSEV